MLTKQEKEEILSLVKKQETLPENLKTKLLTSIKNGEPSIFGDSDYLCCDLGINPPNRYVWTTFDNCRALGGSAADNSNVGVDLCI